MTTLLVLQLILLLCTLTLSVVYSSKPFRSHHRRLPAHLLSKPQDTTPVSYEYTQEEHGMEEKIEKKSNEKDSDYENRIKATQLFNQERGYAKLNDFGKHNIFEGCIEQEKLVKQTYLSSTNTPFDAQQGRYEIQVSIEPNDPQATPLAMIRQDVKIGHAVGDLEAFVVSRTDELKKDKEIQVQKAKEDKEEEEAKAQGIDPPTYKPSAFMVVTPNVGPLFIDNGLPVDNKPLTSVTYTDYITDLTQSKKNYLIFGLPVGSYKITATCEYTPYEYLKAYDTSKKNSKGQYELKNNVEEKEDSKEEEEEEEKEMKPSLEPEEKEEDVEEEPQEKVEMKPEE